MSEFFLFTICRIFDGYVQRIDFDRLDDAKEYYRRHIYDDNMCRIELIGFSSLVGVITILESLRLDKP